MALDELYASGARYFVLHNIAPLQLAPLYANETNMGVVRSQFWKDKPENRTAIAEKMKEYATTINNVYKYQVPYEALLADRFPGANFALFDVYSLVRLRLVFAPTLETVYHDDPLTTTLPLNPQIHEIYTSPQTYLNGTSPANVTGFSHTCDINGTVCTDAASPDSFLWYDALHPSEQVDRVVAREFVGVLGGGSRFARYF